MEGEGEKERANSRLVNVLGTHLGVDDAGMGRVHQDVGILLERDLAVEVARVEDGGELAPAVLRVGPEVGVELVDVFKLDVLGCRLVQVARLVDDAHRVAGAGRLLDEGQEVGGEHDVAHVVEGHVPVDAAVCQLLRHDAPGGVVDEYVEAVRRRGDFVGHGGHLVPVGQVAPDPGRAVGVLLAQLLGHGLLRAPDHVLGHGEDEDPGDVVLEEGVRHAVAYALAAAGHGGHFARQVGAVVEGELVRAQAGCTSAKVLRGRILQKTHCACKHLQARDGVGDIYGNFLVLSNRVGERREKGGEGKYTYPRLVNNGSHVVVDCRFSLFDEALLLLVQTR